MIINEIWWVRERCVVHEKLFRRIVILSHYQSLIIVRRMKFSTKLFKKIGGKQITIAKPVSNSQSSSFEDVWNLLYRTYRLFFVLVHEYLLFRYCLKQYPAFTDKLLKLLLLSISSFDGKYLIEGLYSSSLEIIVTTKQLATFAVLKFI